MVMCIETGNPMPGRAMKITATVASVMPINPPIAEIAIDSVKSSLRMLPG